MEVSNHLLEFDHNEFYFFIQICDIKEGNPKRFKNGTCLKIPYASVGLEYHPNSRVGFIGSNDCSLQPSLPLSKLTGDDLFPWQSTFGFGKAKRNIQGLMNACTNAAKMKWQGSRQSYKPQTNLKK